MADVFISYASEDRERASLVADSLRARGWSVWWDDHIAPGKRFDQVIADELEKARCVVVLWSRISVQKDWVREEATAGKERDVLLPALIENVPLPFGFRMLQTSNLADWTPGAAHREFDTLVASIERLAPRPEAPAGPPPSDREWRRLLGQMRDGTVALVVGQRVLIDPDDPPSVYARVAARLLHEHGVEPPLSGLTPWRELTEALTLLEGSVDHQELYAGIHDALRDLTRRKPDIAALRQLAQIGDLRLIVTLTPDDLLAQALRAEGRTVSEVVHAPRLSTMQFRDLAPAWQSQPGTVHLLYAFGKSQPVPLYALGEDEVEHYVDNIQSRGGNVPTAFLSDLNDRNLLFVGAGFPGWLTRRIARTLAHPHDARAALPSDAQAERLGAFLVRHHGPVCLLWHGSALDFIAELHRRWTAERTAKVGNEAAREPEQTTFFISHSRTSDREAGQVLVDALLSLGATESEIWFASDAGNRSVSADLISGCRCFLPLVSRAALERQEHSVFPEWAEATERLKRGDISFLIPIIVDADSPSPQSYDHASLREWRGQRFEHAPGGHPTPALRAELTHRLRFARRLPVRA